MGVNMNRPTQPDLPDVIVRPKPKTETKKPSMWHVVLLNDDYTPMEFVVFLLMKLFHKDQGEAEAITFQVHIDGKGVAGTYTLEVAAEKADEVMRLARHENHPLQCAVERAE